MLIPTTNYGRSAEVDMKCPACGSDNSENAQFCGICGETLIWDATSIRTRLPMMGFGEAVNRAFRQYFTFSGRATRAEHWWFALL
jgi:predicted RNA-binding Zn-ribbon protein involved in translation (DUF1610 family)